MHIDRTIITDPPDYPTRYQHDPTLEALGDDFTLSAEDDAKIDRASQWGKSLIERARAGDQQALHDLQTKMHIARYVVTR